jgi:hypothetical protein
MDSNDISLNTMGDQSPLHFDAYWSIFCALWPHLSQRATPFLAHQVQVASLMGCVWLFGTSKTVSYGCKDIISSGLA